MSVSTYRRKSFRNRFLGYIHHVAYCSLVWGLIGGLVPTDAYAQSKTKDATTVDTQQSQDKVLSADEWEHEDWTLVKDELSLVELRGYFRTRLGLLRNMNLGNGTTRYSSDGGSLADLSANHNPADMRLRIEPIFNLSPKIRVITTFDVLDNRQFGGVADSLYSQQRTPAHLLATGQDTRIDPQDTLVVKRAYAQLTALNEHVIFNIGRMPNHWGLGMYANSGDCLDCDFGSVADRLSLTFKIAEHLITPMFDWVSSGPLVRPFGEFTAQPIDATREDNTRQWGIRIEKTEDPLYIREETRQGRSVWNYGAWFFWRIQNQDLNSDYYDSFSVGNTATFTPDQFEIRDGTLLGLDIYAEYHSRAFRLGFEAAALDGDFQDTTVMTAAELDNVAVDGPVFRRNQIAQYGAALEMDFDLSPDVDFGSVFEINAGIASGDSAPGFGALTDADGQRGYLQNDTLEDISLNNFQFHPAYHVDMLMYRRIIGTVTDSWYSQAAFGHLFDSDFGLRFAATYSQAMLKRSTPSCDDPSQLRCRGGGDDNTSKMMGLEFDGEISYGRPMQEIGDAFRLSLAGGLLFPFGAFRDNIDSEDPSTAWMLQSRIYLTF